MVSTLIRVFPAMAETENIVWDGTIASGFESGIGTGTDPYIIKTAPQLAYLSQTVNSGTTYSGKYIKLANDIVLNAPDMFTKDENGNIIGAAYGKTPNEWAAIGTSSRNFSGTFDGDNHEIIGIYINNPNKGHQGLFGYCQKTMVKNIGVTDGYINGDSSVGGVIGYSSGWGSTIQHCYNTCTIEGGSNVGGIIGNAYNGTSVYCSIEN